VSAERVFAICEGETVWLSGAKNMENMKKTGPFEKIASVLYLLAVLGMGGWIVVSIMQGSVVQ